MNAKRLGNLRMIRILTVERLFQAASIKDERGSFLEPAKTAQTGINDVRALQDALGCDPESTLKKKTPLMLLLSQCLRYELLLFLSSMFLYICANGFSYSFSLWLDFVLTIWARNNEDKSSSS